MTPKHHETCKAVLKKLESAQKLRHVGMREVFGDFCTISMAAYHNALYSVGKCPVPNCYREIHDKLEADFTETLKKYKDEATAHTIFAEALAMLMLAMREDPFDYLGKIYMDADMGNKSTSQFFTPSHVCELMAAITIGSKEEFEQKAAERGYIGVEDPCCGSAAMIIGMAKNLERYGVENIHDKLFIRLTDIDYTCVKMAFISMCLMGLPAIVIWGNSLTLQVDGQFHTPNMQLALAMGRFSGISDEPPQEQAPPVETPTGTQQLTLF